MEWLKIQSFLVYMGNWNIGMKKCQFTFDGIELVDPSYWQVSFDVVACTFCACVSSKVKNFCSLSANLEVYMLWSWDYMAIVLQL